MIVQYIIAFGIRKNKKYQNLKWFMHRLFLKIMIKCIKNSQIAKDKIKGKTLNKGE